ncbi:zinc-ribbon domain-containing protein [Paeniglutamicibacter antarcticus]|uniref:Zinc-ribbon domain-containing protein n=1 Tax=Arthrobacter terrae TaxID=2935737 RepID=A0A931CRH6_9MICC|nr:zinc-ribbon domain-containing protein [Arthrobacter terrae]MBG0741080.1 zinc-ribbon domain-containing protein [Arthrobacter terrae]
MFLLFGLKTLLRDLPGRMAACQHCGQFVQQRVQERATKLSLFFIPVFTTSKVYDITCTNCGQSSTIKSRQKNALLS